VLNVGVKLVSKEIANNAPRPGGALPHLAIHQSALLGQGLLWRSLGRSLQAFAMRVRRVSRSKAIKKSKVAACVLATTIKH